MGVCDGHRRQRLGGWIKFDGVGAEGDGNSAEERIVIVVSFVAGGEGAVAGHRRRVVADVRHRRVAQRVLAGDEVVNELSRAPDLEGVEPVRAPVAHVVCGSVVVGREEHDRPASREIVHLGVDVAARLRRTDKAELIACGGHRVPLICREDDIGDLGDGIAIVKAKLLCGVDEKSPGRGVEARARAPDGALGGVERREFDHRLDLVGIRRRHVVGDYPGVAGRLDVLDFGVAGRQLPRRPCARRAQRDRGRQNKTEREFLHVITPFTSLGIFYHNPPKKHTPLN